MAGRWKDSGERGRRLVPLGLRGESELRWPDVEHGVLKARRPAPFSAPSGESVRLSHLQLRALSQAGPHLPRLRLRQPVLPKRLCGACPAGVGSTVVEAVPEDQAGAAQPRRAAAKLPDPAGSKDDSAGSPGPAAGVTQQAYGHGRGREGRVCDARGRGGFG